MIDECGLLGAKLVNFPMEDNRKLALATRCVLIGPTQYHRLIDRLIYLTITQPYLTYAGHIFSQFMQAPKGEHMDVARGVLRYLKGISG